MKKLFTVIVLALFTHVHAQEEGLMQDAITKPALSLRCKNMLQERDNKIKIQQRLNALFQRNKILLRKSEKSKASIHNKLLASQIRIKNEIHLNNLNIQTTEENIVRSGCPGIPL
jgi:hypothetical protein